MWLRDREMERIGIGDGPRKCVTDARACIYFGAQRVRMGCGCVMGIDWVDWRRKSSSLMGRRGKTDREIDKERKVADANSVVWKPCKWRLEMKFIRDFYVTNYSIAKVYYSEFTFPLLALYDILFDEFCMP